jgi:hypothetical protein
MYVSRRLRSDFQVNLIIQTARINEQQQMEGQMRSIILAFIPFDGASSIHIGSRETSVGTKQVE